MRLIERQTLIQTDGTLIDEPVKVYDVSDTNEAWVAGGNIVRDFYDNHYYALQENPGSMGFSRMTLETSIVSDGANARVREVWEICAEVSK